MVPSLPLLSCESSVSVKENPDRKKNNEIIYNTEVSKSNLRDYSDAYILVKGDITVTTAPATEL